MYDADELENKIDKAFQQNICEPRRNEVVQFFQNVLSSKEGFRLLDVEKDLEVIDIVYYANEPLSHLFAQPCSEFYDYEYQLDLPTLSMEGYRVYKIENLVKEAVQAEGIYLSEAEQENFDTATYWENQHELEMSFLIDCWREAISDVPTTTKAFLFANDGAGYVLDLDTGKKLVDRDNSTIADYLLELGIQPKKMLIEREEEEEEPPSFWRRLFGTN